jgi:hypothetical protein
MYLCAYPRCLPFHPRLTLHAELVRRMLDQWPGKVWGSGEAGGEAGQPDSVSEIEFWAPYVVDGRSLFACILRFEDAKTDYSDTLLI